MNELLPYRTEITALVQAVANEQLAQALERLQGCYQLSDPRVLEIVIFFERREV
jgi:hypothetical protein